MASPVVMLPLSPSVPLPPLCRLAEPWGSDSRQVSRKGAGTAFDEVEVLEHLNAKTYHAFTERNQLELVLNPSFPNRIPPSRIEMDERRGRGKGSGMRAAGGREGGRALNRRQIG